MNVLKNVMFFIIAIQVMVMIELATVQFLLKKSAPSRQPSTILRITKSNSKDKKLQEYSLTKEKKKFILSIATAIDKKIKSISFIPKDFFSVSEFESRERIVSQAKKFLGIPYVWGATGPNRFDCSGFTQKIYKTAGIELPRHSTRQAMVGEYIKFENLERGDMVFFDTSKRHRGVVNHVGIYLEDGKFIHASSGKKKVVITDFEKKRFYKKRFLWGRRILDPVKKARLKHLSINDKVKTFLLFREI